MEGILADRDNAHDSEDAEALLLRYQIVQPAMEKNSANLTDEWYIDKQMTKEPEDFHRLPSDEMNNVKKL